MTRRHASGRTGYAVWRRDRGRSGEDVFGRILGESSSILLVYEVERVLMMVRQFTQNYYRIAEELAQLDDPSADGL
jgi:hypothetical protein